MTTLQERLRSDAAHHQKVASECDCPPQDTTNWEHMQNAMEAADCIDDLEAQAKNQTLNYITLFGELENALAQVAQYKADAERYLGLRRLLYSGTVDVGEAYVSMKVVGSFPDQIQFDGGIDAAIQKGTK